MAGAEPKGHHYVPAMYLRGFTGEKNQLFAINRPEKKWFRTSPDNVAKKKHFNRIEVKGMEPNVLEKALSEFEGEVAPALERIKATKSLAVEADRSLLVNFMAAVALRNPRRREDLGKIISHAKRQEAVARFGGDALKAASIKEENFAASKEEIVMAEIDQHDPLTERLWHRKWQMVIAPEGSGGFVTTDDPVCLRWSDGGAHGGLSPGFAVAGTEVIFPISTSICLRGTFEGEENVVDANAATVARINSLIISNVENQVYAHDHSFKFMRKEPDALGSGATLLEDEKFMEAGKAAPIEGNIVALKAK